MTLVKYTPPLIRTTAIEFISQSRSVFRLPAFQLCISGEIQRLSKGQNARKANEANTLIKMPCIKGSQRTARESIRHKSNEIQISCPQKQIRRQTHRHWPRNWNWNRVCPASPGPGNAKIMRLQLLLPKKNPKKVETKAKAESQTW